MAGTSNDLALEAVLKGKSSRSRANYASTLARCLTITNSATLKVMLMGRARSFNKLAAAYPRPPTLKTVLAIMCSVITANVGMVTDSCGVYWRTRMGDAIKASDELAANNVASPALLKKWIEYDSIKTKLDQLLADEGHTKNQMSQDIVLMAVFAHLSPKRRDLGKVKVVQTIDDIAKDENGVVIPEHGAKGKLVLNEYKTAKTYGHFEEDLPKELTLIIKASLAAHPRPYLFCGPRGKPLSDSRYGTRVSDAMDRHMDKKLTVNDLRHLFITQNIKLDRVTHAQRADIASSMMHSPTVQLEYMRTS
jgi:hypothetical protein